MAEETDGRETDSGAAGAHRPLRPEHAVLPHVESVPLSPADAAPDPVERTVEPKPEPEIVAANDAARDADASSGSGAAFPFRAGLAALRARLNFSAMPSWRRIALAFPTGLKRRYRRLAMTAATVALAAILGAVAGARFGGHTEVAPGERVAPAEIARLDRQIAALKEDLKKVTAATSAATKTAERVARAEARKVAEAELAKASADVTGSIPPAAESPPIPPPRPIGQITAAASRLPPVVRGWTLRHARNGLFLVEGRGELYEVVPGAPLPGIGPVQAIKRLDGRWVVVTPKGLIVSLRDRRHFE